MQNHNSLPHAIAECKDITLLIIGAASSIGIAELFVFGRWSLLSVGYQDLAHGALERAVLYANNPSSSLWLIPVLSLWVGLGFLLRRKVPAFSYGLWLAIAPALALAFMQLVMGFPLFF